MILRIIGVLLKPGISKMSNVENLVIPTQKVTQEDAEKAIQTLLHWIGEEPNREGLKETPKRVVESYLEYFAGYNLNPYEVLHKTFTETSGYDGVVLLKDIRIESHCEHHLAPIIGKAHIAYIPDKRVVGISKLARVAEIFSKRLQLQERLTSQIANAIDTVLQPKGVAVAIEAKHHCIGTRGIHKTDSAMYTDIFIGCFKTDDSYKKEFLQKIS